MTRARGGRRVGVCYDSPRAQQSSRSAARRTSLSFGGGTPSDNLYELQGANVRARWLECAICAGAIGFAGHTLQEVYIHKSVLTTGAIPVSTGVVVHIYQAGRARVRAAPPCQAGMVRIRMAMMMIGSRLSGGGIRCGARV